MAYLVTGSSGFLGNIIATSLMTQRKEVFRLGRTNQQINIDIGKNFTIEERLPIRTVIHCAGKAHSVPKTSIEKQEFYHVNFEGTKNLCKALEKLDTLPKSFVFMSTIAVYGLDEGHDISEDYPLNGSTPYAESKIMAEDWLRNWSKRNGVILSIIRLPLVAGINPPGNLSAMINGIKSGWYLRIGKADARKSIIWAEDVAEAIPTLAENDGIYNLTDGYHPTFRELEQVIASALGKQRQPVKIPYWCAKSLALVGDLIGGKFPINSNKLDKITSTLTFDDSKARQELNWKPTPVLTKLNEVILSSVKQNESRL